MGPEIIALIASFSYALFTLYGWFGLRYSTALVATIVSLASRTIILWIAVFLLGGIPEFAQSSLSLFVFLGLMQSVTSLLTFVGLHKIGTARSQPLRNAYPLFSALIAVAIMQEQAGALILLGTILVVGGVILISWKPDVPPPGYRWWHILYSLSAGALAGVAFPLRRYGLSITNEPVFFAAVVAVVSLLGALPALSVSREKTAVWNKKGIVYFIVSGFFEAVGALLALVALSTGRVVVVSPIVATTPLWNLLIAVIFFKDREEVNARTVAGTIAVFSGTIAIALGR